MSLNKRLFAITNICLLMLTLLLIPIQASAATTPYFPKCDSSSLAPNWLYNLSVNEASTLKSTDSSVAIVLVKVPINSSSYYLNPYGTYIITLAPGPSSINLWTPTTGQAYIETAYSGSSQQSIQKSYSVSAQGIVSTTVNKTNYVSTTNVNPSPISCITVIKGSVSQVASNPTTALHNNIEPVVNDYYKIAPYADPVQATNGINFEPNPNAPSTPTTPTTGGTTVVNAGDLTKEYVHSLAIKLVSGGIAALFAYEILKQFRWRSND